MEFSQDQSTFTVDNQYMIGDKCPFNFALSLSTPLLLSHLCFSEFNCLWFHTGGALLACPVTEPGLQEVKVSLPGSGEVNQLPANIFICSNIFISADVKVCFCFRFGMMSTLQRCTKEARLWVFQSPWTQSVFNMIHTVEGVVFNSDYSYSYWIPFHYLKLK